MRPPRPGLITAPSLALFFVLCLVLGAVQCYADSSKISAEGAAFFETHIRPTLVTECIECHGSEKQKGGLRLDSRKGWQKGGDSGASIIPNNPEASLLLRSIKHLEPDLKMPEKAPKLDEAILQNFTRWIAMGAPDPREEPPAGALTKASWPELLAARRSWWSLQPLQAHNPFPGALPPQGSRMTQATPATHPVDGFLNTALTKAGLSPASAATADVLARRLHFILIGLPPSPDEVRSFVAAYERDPEKAVKERARSLLASPFFGEHWARRWMDLVRYAESHGSEGDPEIPGAYQYRDYLIRAFNADVPLDQLIREHLAGDLLTTPRVSPNGVNESRIGPAHLRMCEHGYQPVDTLDDQIKAIDNQIDVVSKAFQGLTVSCARCHDHKFDAISQRDYTALYGVFSSVRPAQLSIDTNERLQLSKKDQLLNLKALIRDELSKVWLSKLNHFAETLSLASQNTEKTELTELRERLSKIDNKLASKQWTKITENASRRSPAPYALWTFSEGAEDRMGRLRSELVGGATVQNGALLLNGKSAFLRTENLPVETQEKTLEAWLSTSNLEQRGSGIVGIEQISAHAFDSLVFAEKQPRKWLAGSNNHVRTEQTDGIEENSGKDEVIHVAVTYAADGTISVFQNGQPYGKPFRKDALHVYPINESRVLIGLRHTGAGNGFFGGKIHEARLYTRALSAEEIAASFADGMLPPAKHSKTDQKTAQEDPEIEKLTAESAKLREQIAMQKPVSEPQSISKITAPPEHPLHMAYQAATGDPKTFSAKFSEYKTKMTAKIMDSKSFNAENFTDFWNLGEGKRTQWFTSGPDTVAISRGDFRVSKDGETAFESLLPAGIGASTLIPQFGGVAMSPEFKITSKYMSVRYAATNGAMMRVICDNYPLGIAPIFPRTIVQRTSPAWSVLNTEYRMNTSAFLEMSTPGHQTRRAEPPKDSPAFNPLDSYFVLEKVVFHDSKETPKDVHPGLEWTLEKCSAASSKEYLTSVGKCLAEAVIGWRDGGFTEAQRDLLNSAIQTRILSVETSQTRVLQEAISQYRTITKAMPQPVFAPGVLEHSARDAAFLPRGDHKKPGESVPRGFIEVLDAKPITGSQSGRLELADRILSPLNPLTSRVMANRIWLWTFGAGIVGTPDNFGRMGEKPSHPELLDFLASKLLAEGWSIKRMLAYLIETEAFQRSSTATEEAARIDPLNALLSHASVRRLEAESIRDALLSISGKIDLTQYGPSVAHNIPRRSVYLQQKRNSLPPLLTTFDAPKPFTTLGRRDSTTVPAQSLTLLNDPYIVQLAKQWGENVSKTVPAREEQIQRMFESAFGRSPTVEELERSQAFLRKQGNERDLAPLAHAIFNLKEFIYLR